MHQKQPPAKIAILRPGSGVGGAPWASTAVLAARRARAASARRSLEPMAKSSCSHPAYGRSFDHWKVTTALESEVGCRSSEVGSRPGGGLIRHLTSDIRHPASRTA